MEMAKGQTRMKMAIQYGAPVQWLLLVTLCKMTWVLSKTPCIERLCRHLNSSHTLGSLKSKTY